METAATKAKCHVSKLMSRALKLNATSSHGSFLAKNRTLIEEYLYFTSKSNTLVMVQGGSVVEGTHITGSDRDRMVVASNITVHTNSRKVGCTKGHRFLLDEADSSPGYGRLRLINLQGSDFQIYDLDKTDIRDLFQETTDGNFLSSEKFKNLLVSCIKIAKQKEYLPHGPCATGEQFGSMIDKPGIKSAEDVAHALVCDEWPAGAQKWITRKRSHDWPPKNIIEKISKMKCHAVPVGNSRSSNFSLEWRISFLLGERELVWNFNDTQVQCYVLLKKLLKKHIEQIAPDQLSSYHIKTTMFWMAEEQGMLMWCDENLLGCVAECLNKLSHSVRTKKLQHYFYRENNLLYNKFDNSSDKERVLQKIYEIQEDLEQCVSECLGGWKTVTEVCNSCQTLHKNFINWNTEISCQQEDYEQIMKRQELLILYRSMLIIYVNTSLGSHLPTFVRHQHLSFEQNPPEDIDRQILEMTKVFIAIRLGMSFCGHIAAPEDVLFQFEPEGTSISMQDAYNLLDCGRQLDDLSGTLYLASIYLWEGKFLSSQALVLSVLRQDKLLVHSGWSSKRVIRLTKEGKAKLESTTLLTGTEEKIFPAYDVIFSSVDDHCVPYPVKFECVLAQTETENFIMIHPCVYAYFLLCVGQFRTGQFESYANTLEQLQQLVCELGDELNVHRALNLVGHCYYLGGNVNAALRCYSSSLNLTPSSPNMVVNAAAFHICIILVKCLE